MPTINGQPVGTPMQSADDYAPAIETASGLRIPPPPRAVRTDEAAPFSGPEPSALVREETAGMSPEQAQAQLARIRGGMGGEWGEAWTDGSHPAHADAVAYVSALHRIAAGEAPAGAPTAPRTAQGAQQGQKGRQPTGAEPQLTSDPGVRAALAASMSAATPSGMVEVHGAEAVEQAQAEAADLFARAGVNGQEARELWQEFATAGMRQHLRTPDADAAEAEATEAALREAWGDQFDAQLARAEEAAASWGVSEQIQRLGLGGNRRIIETLARVGPRDASGPAA